MLADVAIGIDDERLLTTLMAYSTHLNDIDFALYLEKLENLSVQRQTLELFQALQSYAHDWSDERQLDVNTRLGEVTIKVSSPLEILLKLPTLSTISEAKAKDYADDAKREIIATADIDTIEKLVASTEALDTSELTALLMDIFKAKQSDLELCITTKIGLWRMPTPTHSTYSWIPMRLYLKILTPFHL